MNSEMSTASLLLQGMDHWDDKAHLTDEFKQKNILIAVAGSQKWEELHFLILCEETLFNEGNNNTKVFHFNGGGRIFLSYSILFVCLFILEKSNTPIYWQSWNKWGLSHPARSILHLTTFW